MPQAVPNYLSTNTNGETSATFPGGLDILASQDQNYFGGDRLIRWTDEGNGRMVGRMYGIANPLTPGSSGLEIQAGDQSVPTSQSSSIGLSCVNAALGETRITMSKGAVGQSANNDFLLIVAGSTVRFLLDGNGASDYRQVADTAVMQFNGGWTNIGQPSPNSGNVVNMSSAGPRVIHASVTGYNFGGSPIGCQLWVNGAVVDSVQLAATAPAGMHVALPTMMARVNLNKGANYFWLQQWAGTSDGNDYLRISIT